MMRSSCKHTRFLFVSASLFLAFATSCQAEDKLASAMEMFAEHRYAAGLVPLQTAAEMGDRDARRTLGLMLLYGQSLYTEVSTNREQGLRWLRMAAGDGCETSQYMLAKFRSE